MSYQDDTWNYFKGKNLPEYSIGAIMGNIQMESGFDPNVIESTTGVGYGLCQWSYSRRTQLEAYGTDIQHQLDFLWSELTGQNLDVTGANYQWIQQSGYLTNSDFMNGNGSIDDLTSAFCFCWERPDSSVAHLSDRQNYATQYYNQYTGTGGTGGTGGGGGSTGTTYCKLINPYWYGSQIKISFLINQFLIVNYHGNVVRIKNELTNRHYYVNKSSIKII